MVEAQTKTPRADLPNRPARKKDFNAPPAQPSPTAAQPAASRAPASPFAAKPSRRTPKGQTRLHMSVGSEMGVDREAIIRAIQGQTGLPSSAIGEVDLRDRYTFVDVAAEHANAIVSKLKRAELGNQRLKVKLAKQPADQVAD